MMGEVAALREALTLAVELGRKYSSSAEIESFFIGSPGKEQLQNDEGGECVGNNDRDITSKEYPPSPQILGDVISSPQNLGNVVSSPQDVPLVSSDEIDDLFEFPSILCSNVAGGDPGSATLSGDPDTATFSGIQAQPHFHTFLFWLTAQCLSNRLFFARRRSCRVKSLNSASIQPRASPLWFLKKKYSLFVMTHALLCLLS